MAEVIDIGISKLDDSGPTIKINDGPSAPKSVNFGPGLDMLMNDKRRSNSGNASKSDINLDDLNKLESELHDLADDGPSKKLNEPMGISKPFSLGGDDNIKLNIEPTNVKLDDGINLGKSTGDAGENGQGTWDGFKKFNDIPVDPAVSVPKEPAMSKQELLAKKFEYLKKLETIERKGAKLSKKYSMDDSLDEMRGEYEMIMSEKEKSNSVKFQGKIMMACVTALEYLNNKFDPFDFKLDGWSESVQENIDDYDEIFSELHEKYKSKAKMAPELKLLFQLGGSAVMLHMTNTMFKSAMPGMDDIMRQNPELMQQFTSAAVNSMSQNNPGFGGFMGGIMGGGNTMPPRGSPPGPSQPDLSRRPEMIPPGPGNRPDIGMSRGVPDFKDAANMDDNFGSVSLNQGRQNNTQRERVAKSNSSGSRAEMKGPSDLSNLLSGLKTKKVNVRQEEMMGRKSGGGGGSTISIDELKSISKDADNMPRKSKRRPRSERNTVSLDI